ncbi:nucleotidyltransferase [Methylobacterium gregans]|uniref:DNA-directed DNA polymerase n=1 Tax=Methylobacterium gregans TaxID=374424 RepID=A0AA37HNF6_9HYPH|nr:DNA polymerase Y family protein [Methylobacterium gregans]MDQ0518848.1 protein ImuB [Methylobacterium gregans]GJD79047.1 Protein ImuB [Methylobacterium gregans]GLS57251.1 nucleotidyltransferase [Methylobacterium gregans]
MRRVVSLYLPTWPSDRIRRRDPAAPPRDKPLVTATAANGARVVASACRAAQALGLRAGMAIAQVQAMVPDITVREATPDADADALARLAAWCLWCAPLTAPDPPDGLWIEIAGSAHLFGGEAAMLRTLLARLRGGGCTVRLAVADTPGAAWAVARFAPREISPLVGPGQMAAAVASLPVRALRLAPETVAELAELGIERVAQLAALPRGPLSLRVGRAVLQRLDQVLGHAPEPIAWAMPAEAVLVRRAFPEPISAPSTLERVATDLIGDLVALLARRGLGARRIDLSFRRVDGGVHAICVGTATATRDAAHLARLLCARLAEVDPGFGLDEATLAAGRTEPLAAVQGEGLDTGETAQVDLAVLVDRLAARAGARRVFRVVPVESRVPERSQRRAPPLAPTDGRSWPTNLARPARLFEPPEPVQATALLPDAPPALFVWRGVRHRVVRADGPERVRGEWWAAEGELASLRDYYRVETEDGARYWIYRDAPMAEGPRWWLQGVFG